MQPWLLFYANQGHLQDSQLILHGFDKGFSLQYTGPAASRDAKNLASALQLPHIVAAKLNKEVSSGRVAGPFSTRPISNLKVSPIGLVPKKSASTDSNGKSHEHFRLIHHLSHPHGSSVNDHIDDSFCTVQYTNFDHAITMVQRLGKGALLAKLDVKSAFRLLPVRPEDFHLLGMYFQDNFYFDKALPFGCAISCSLFEKFSSFLEWCIKNKTQSQDIMHYLDDFLMGGASGTNHCYTLLHACQQMFQYFGVPMAPEKTVGPTTVITFLGLVIDTDAMQIRIPTDKIVALVLEINTLLQPGKCKTTIHNIQSLLGKLQFVSRALRGARAFSRRLYDLLGRSSNPKYRVRLTNGIKEDLRVWLNFLQNFNGISVFHHAEWLSGEQLDLYTDASGTNGFGAYFKGRWTYGKWPESWERAQLTRDMTLLEFFPIVVSLRLWGHNLRNKQVMFFCDNQAVVSIINCQSSKNKYVMHLVRTMVSICLHNNIIFRSSYISTHHNVVADAISRFQWQRFFRAAPEADRHPTPLPPDVWEYCRVTLKG